MKYLELYEKFSILKKKDLLKFCKENLEKINCGSSRCVFEYNKNKVIKVATNEFGKVQNIVEGMIFNRNKETKYLSKIYDYDKNDGKYLIAERGEKLNKNLFKEITGVNFKDYCKGFKEIKSSNSNINHLYKIIKEEELQIDDMKKIGSYGIFGNMIKIIDYGYTDNLEKWIEEKEEE